MKVNICKIYSKNRLSLWIVKYKYYYKTVLASAAESKLFSRNSPKFLLGLLRFLVTSNKCGIFDILLHRCKVFLVLHEI